MSAPAKKKIVALVPPAPVIPAGLLPWEYAEGFLTLQSQMLAAHAPQGPTEAALVDRIVWCEWRRRRVLAAEAAVHVAHASDRSHDGQAKAKLLQRAGLTDHTVRDEISVPEVVRGKDADDRETVAAVEEGIADIEATLGLIDAGASLADAVGRMDEDLADWWREALEETDHNDQLKYANSVEGLKRFLTVDALPWRRKWLAANVIRPAIRTQVHAESFDAHRIRQLWEMEGRLDRQFEKALAMLIRLQEMRAPTGKAS